MSRLEKLLDDLFTNGAGEKATRLVLVEDGGVRRATMRTEYRDLGGRCRSSVRDVLLRHFPELAEERR